jgi:hypothetical protein
MSANPLSESHNAEALTWQSGEGIPTSDGLQNLQAITKIIGMRDNFIDTTWPTEGYDLLIFGNTASIRSLAQ